VGEGSFLIYGISDLHFFLEGGAGGNLPGGLIFRAIPPGLIRRWREEVWGHDSVLIPGDISDSSTGAGIQADYEMLDRLPGRKVLSPGNHDSGPWRSQEEIDRFCAPFPSLTAITAGVLRLAAQPDAPGLVVAAAPGSCAPGDAWFADEPSELGPDDPSLRFRVELGNLKHALAEAERIAQPTDRLVVQIHYPPFVNLTRPGPFSDLIEAAGADLCLYGHLHRESESGFEGQRNGVRYRIVSAPRLQMCPLRLGELTKAGVRWVSEGSDAQ
jgi:predicted phosphohydrolase